MYIIYKIKYNVYRKLVPFCFNVPLSKRFSKSLTDSFWSTLEQGSLLFNFICLVSIIGESTIGR